MSPPARRSERRRPPPEPSGQDERSPRLAPPGLPWFPWSGRRTRPSAPGRSLPRTALGTLRPLWFRPGAPPARPLPPTAHQRSASTSCSRACFSARHRSICSSILRSTPSIQSVLPSISCSFPWSARDADDGLLLLGVSHLTTFRPVFSLLWVALVGHLVASGRPPRIDRPVVGMP